MIREEIETNASGTCSPLFSSSTISTSSSATPRGSASGPSGAGSGGKIKVRRRILADEESLYLAQSKWDGKGLFTMITRDEALEMDHETRRESIMRIAKSAKGSLSKLTRMSSLKAVSGLRWKEIMSKGSRSHTSRREGQQQQRQQPVSSSQNNSFESTGEGSETDLRRWTLSKQYSSSVNSSSSVTLPQSEQQQQQQTTDQVASSMAQPNVDLSSQTQSYMNRSSSDRDIQSEGGEEKESGGETPFRWRAFKSSSLRFKRLSLKGWRHRK